MDEGKRRDSFSMDDLFESDSGNTSNVERVGDVDEAQTSESVSLSSSSCSDTDRLVTMAREHGFCS